MKDFTLNDFNQLEIDVYVNRIIYSFQIAFIRLYKEIYKYNSHEDSTYQETYGYKIYLSYDENYKDKIEFLCSKEVFEDGKKKIFCLYDEEVRKGCGLIEYPVILERNNLLTINYKEVYYEEIVFYNTKCICGGVY
jgi:hypothetical protein